MKPPFLLLLLLLAGLPMAAQKIYLIKVDGTINPASAQYIHESLDKAAEEKAECLLIRLNTPGGLLKSTRVIVSDLLEAPLPVLAYA